MSHTEIRYDASEQINMRYRLFARAIRINGLSQINALQTYLQARLAKTLAIEFYAQDADSEVDLFEKCKLCTNHLLRLEACPNRSSNARLGYRNARSVLLWK